MSSPMPSLINQVARGCRAVCAQQVLPLDSPVSKPAAMSLQQVAPCRRVITGDVEVDVEIPSGPPWISALDRRCSTVHRGVCPHDDRFFGRGACDQELDGNGDTIHKIYTVQAVNVT